MHWIILLALIGAGLIAVLFALVTDGRYFGKRLIYWAYDRLGPTVFSARREAGHWHSLVESIALRGDERILDVATAVGDLPLTMASMPDFRGQIVGVDWSARMMGAAQAEARRQGLEDKVRFVAVDVRERLPFATGELDVLVCLGLLETLHEPEGVLEELTRVVRRNGVLALSLCRGWTARIAALSLAWYDAHLGPLGLDRLQVVACRKHHNVVIARRGSRDRGGD